jgi:DNA-binding response OmpR family regulator
MKGTILLVEDSAPFRRTFKGVIQEAGFDVIEAEDGEVGLWLSHTAKPSLVVLDLLLPVKSGYDVLREIRTTPATRDLPVIILSLLGEEVDIQKGLDLGANDYMVKGFHSAREVVRKIKSVLADRNRTRALTTYHLFVDGKRDDAGKLQQEIGLDEGFRCSECEAGLRLHLVPDFSRSEGHWFSAQLVCAGCRRGF